MMRGCWARVRGCECSSIRVRECGASAMVQVCECANVRVWLERNMDIWTCLENNLWGMWRYLKSDRKKRIKVMLWGIENMWDIYGYLEICTECI